jgi:hypothetical protein
MTGDGQRRRVPTAGAEDASALQRHDPAKVEARHDGQVRGPSRAAPARCSSWGAVTT